MAAKTPPPKPEAAPPAAQSLGERIVEIASDVVDGIALVARAALSARDAIRSPESAAARLKDHGDAVAARRPKKEPAP